MFEGYLGCTTEYLDVSLKMYTYKRAPQRTYLERGCVHVGTQLYTRVYTTVYTQVYFSPLNSRDMLCEPTPIVAVLLSNRMLHWLPQLRPLVASGVISTLSPRYPGCPLLPLLLSIGISSPATHGRPNTSPRDL